MDFDLVRFIRGVCQVILLLAIAVSTSHAQTVEIRYLTHKELCNRSESAGNCKQCKDRDGGLKDLEALERNLREVASWIEAVPPLDNEFLNREAHLMGHGSKARLQMAMKNQYYAAWQLHRNFGETLESINQLKRSDKGFSFPPTEKNQKLNNISKAVRLSWQAATVREAFNSYVDHDFSRSVSVLTLKRVEEGNYLLTTSSYLIGEYVKCVIADLKDYLPP